jgi:hypothetical protein
MGINKVVCLAILFLGVAHLHAGNFEQQYKLKNTDAFQKILQTKDTLMDGFQFFLHHTYLYQDIYLDTPEKWMKKNGYSLRIRKQQLENEKLQYHLQLKTEMSDRNAVRMEIEEELDRYFFPGKDTLYLTAIIDRLFHASNDSIFMSNKKRCLEWIILKSKSPVKPFLKLRHLLGEETAEKLIHSLQITVIGHSTRKRIHVYRCLSKDLKANQKANSEIPEWFHKNTQYVWLAEASLDSSVFFHANEFSQKSVLIEELEIEQKYVPEEIGAAFLNRLFLILQQELKMVPESKSKYVQALDLLF